MTFAQWFLLNFEMNLTAVIVITAVCGIQVGAAMERSLRR